LSLAKVTFIKKKIVGKSKSLWTMRWCGSMLTYGTRTNGTYILRREKYDYKKKTPDVTRVE